jgi:hypothetical protein
MSMSRGFERLRGIGLQDFIRRNERQPSIQADHVTPATIISAATTRLARNGSRERPPQWPRRTARWSHAARDVAIS